jgi:hypothetical protein
LGKNDQKSAIGASTDQLLSKGQQLKNMADYQRLTCVAAVKPIVPILRAALPRSELEHFAAALPQTGLAFF